MKAKSVLQIRIIERLNALDRTARDVSISAGLGPDAIRTILTGRSRSPRGENIAALAKELQCDVGYLLGEVDTPGPSSARLSPSHSDLADPISIKFAVGLAWNQNDDHLLSHESDIYPLRHYAASIQHLELLTDEHASEIFPKNSFVHCLDISDDRAVVVRDRDVIVLESRRVFDGKASVQRSVRRVRVYGDTYVVATMSRVESLRDEINLGPLKNLKSKNLAHTDSDGVSHRVAALVLRGITHVSGPEIGHPPKSWSPPISGS